MSAAGFRDISPRNRSRPGPRPGRLGVVASENRRMKPTSHSAAATLLHKWHEAQREHHRACRERIALIRQRHQELLEIVGYYQGLQAAYLHLRRLRPLDDAARSG
jgi:hypothetical protein